MRALMLRLTGVDIERCRLCRHGRMRVTEILAPAASRGEAAVQAWDTS